MLLLQISTKPRDGSPRERRRDKKQHNPAPLLPLPPLHKTPKKNLQTKISLPMWGFLAQMHSTHKEGTNPVRDEEEEEEEDPKFWI